MKPRKFKVGVKLRLVSELLYFLDLGRWVYFGDPRQNPRPKHPSFIKNMMLQVILGALRRGHLHLAEPNS